MAARHRVAVTGMGVVSPLGNAVGPFVDALIAGRSGITSITVFDPASLPTRIGGQAELPPEVPFGDRKIAFALEAARQAMTQAWPALADRAAARAAANEPPRDVDRTAGVSLGVGLELFAMADLVASRARGFELPEPHQERLRFMQTPSDMCVHILAHRYGLGAPPLLSVSACAAGTDAIGLAFRAIACGQRRWMLTGGTDSMLNPLGVAGFCALSATSTRNDPPEKASRPFDRTRDGFVMGEGAGILVLERLEDARRRGAPVLGEIAGYGCSFDAHKIGDPHPEGRGAWQAMLRALEDAGSSSAELDAVNAHGTGTPKNDVAETIALGRLLGDRRRQVPISATKSMIGHLISAAGAVEAIAAIGCMRRGVVHPTINLDHPDPDCDLDYVPHRGRSHAQRLVLSTSYGFGGHNAAIAIRAAEG